MTRRLTTGAPRPKLRQPNQAFSPGFANARRPRTHHGYSLDRLLVGGVSEGAGEVFGIDLLFEGAEFGGAGFAEEGGELDFGEGLIDALIDAVVGGAVDAGHEEVSAAGHDFGLVFFDELDGGVCGLGIELPGAEELAAAGLAKAHDGGEEALLELGAHVGEGFGGVLAELFILILHFLHDGLKGGLLIGGRRDGEA